MMQVIAEMGARLFERLVELKKKAASRTKPAPTVINITGRSGINISGKETDDTQ